MYALSFSAEGDCYRCVPPDPSIAAAALGASASCTPPGTAPAEAFLHLFHSDLLTCLGARSWPVPPLSSRVRRMVTTTTPGGQRVSICTCTWTGRHLATFTHRPGSSLYTLATEPPQVATSARYLCSGVRVRSGSRLLLVSPSVAPDSSLAPPPGSPLPATPSWHALPSPCLWSPQVSASLTALVCPALSSLRRGAAVRRSSILVSPDDCSPADPPHRLRLQLRERFGQDQPVLRLHSERGGEFSSDFLREFCRGEGITQSFTLPDSPQQNGIAKHRIGLVVKVARTSMIHAAAPHFLWLFADVTFDESVPFYRPFPYCSAPPPPPPLFLAPGPPPVDPLPPQGPAPSGVSQVDPLPGTAPVQVADVSGAARGATSGGATSGGAEPGGAGSEGAGSWGAEPEGDEPGGTNSEGAESGGAEPRGAASSGGPAGAGPSVAGVGSLGARDAGAAGDGAVDPGAGGAGGTVRPRPYFVPLLQQVLVVPSSIIVTIVLNVPKTKDRVHRRISAQRLQTLIAFCSQLQMI
ncbi:unnamed protein product [Closterium sp. NIES-54]